MITFDESLHTPWCFREYPQLTHRFALQFLSMPIVFMWITLQTWSWLKSNNSTILVMGNNSIVQGKLTFVQASCFINGIYDNNSILVWKTILFLQTCATREYDFIKMLVLTDVFPRAPFKNRFVYLLFSSYLQTGCRIIWRHFHTPIWDHTNSSGPPWVEVIINSKAMVRNCLTRQKINSSKLIIIFFSSLKSPDK